MHIGNTAIGDPCLCSVENPFIMRFVVNSTCAQRTDIAAGIRFAHAKRSECNFFWGSVTLWYPLDDLLRSSVTSDSSSGESGSHDGHADSGIAPKHLFDCDWECESGWVCHAVHQELNAIQANFGCLLHNGERELFAFIPLLGSGSNHVDSELVDPVLDLNLVIIEVE